MNYVTTLVLFLFTNQLVGQSPWVDAKGSYYGQVSATFLAYSNVFNARGEVVATNFNTTDNTIGYYGSYSITNNTAFLVDAPFKLVASNNQSLSGLGDIKLKVKHQVYKKIPIGIHYGYTATTSNRNGILRTGYNQHGLELGASIGLGKEKFYAYGFFGYRYRHNIPNQVLIDAEFGYAMKLANRKMYLMLHIDGALNTSTATDLIADETVLYHNNGDYLSPGLKISYNVFNKFWLNLSGFGAFFAKNQAAAPTISVGLAYDLKR